MGICICCCCNKKDTNCLENTLIVFNSIEIFYLLSGLILIDWKIAAYSNLAINLILLFILIFSLAILVIFKIFRGNNTIYTKNKKLCYILGIIGMSLSILCLFLSILSESLISENIYRYDHPCLYRLLDKNINTDSNTHRIGTVYDDKIYNETQIKKKCDEFDLENVFWYYERSSPKDIAMCYICSTIIEIFSLIGVFFWYNDIKRIKYCIKDTIDDESEGVIIYGSLGGYLGQKSDNNIVHKIRNGEIIYLNNNNSLLNINSSNGDNKKIRNEITNLQNDEIINEIDDESYTSNRIEVNKKKESSVFNNFY